MEAIRQQIEQLDADAPEARQLLLLLLNKCQLEADAPEVQLVLNKCGYRAHITAPVPGAAIHFVPTLPLGRLLKSGRRLVDAADQKQFVYGVFEELIANDEVQLRFDWKKVVDAIIDGKPIVVNGEPQAGKTSIVPLAHVCGVAMARPVVVLCCVPLSNAAQLSIKYKDILRAINSTSYMQMVQMEEEDEEEEDEEEDEEDKGPLVCADIAGMTAKERSAFFDAGARAAHFVTTGLRSMFVTGHKAQIERIMKLFSDKQPHAAVVVMDEADKMWNSAIMREDVEEGMRGIRGFATRREEMFYRLALQTCTPHAAPGSMQELFPGLHSLVQVSATNTDTLTWHMKMQLPFVPVALDKDAVREHGYGGFEILEPLVDGNGSKVFMKTSYTPSNDYAYDSSEMQIFRQRIVTDAAAVGTKGILALDIVTPRVYAQGHNCQDRAHRVASEHEDWIVMYVNGSGVYVTRKDDGGFTDAQLCNFRKRKINLENEEHDEIACREISDAIAKYDDYLHVPIYLVGYLMIRRSVSTRSGPRVVTHAVTLPSKGISLPDFIQMIGRCWGRVKGVLEENGFENITVLVRKDDYDATRVWTAFTEEVFERAGDKSVEEMLEWASSNFPASIFPAVDHMRSMGNKRIGTTKMFRDAMKFERVEDSQDASEDAVSVPAGGRPSGFDSFLLDKYPELAELGEPGSIEFVLGAQDYLGCYGYQVLQKVEFIADDEAYRAAVARESMAVRRVVISRAAELLGITEEQAGTWFSVQTADSGAADASGATLPGKWSSSKDKSNRALLYIPYIRHGVKGIVVILQARKFPSSPEQPLCTVPYVYQQFTRDDGVDAFGIDIRTSEWSSGDSVKARILAMVLEHRATGTPWSGSAAQLGAAVGYPHPVYYKDCLNALERDGFLAVDATCHPKQFKFIV